jgi:hypothetical protein
MIVQEQTNVTVTGRRGTRIFLPLLSEVSGTRHSVSNNLALFLPVCILCLGPKQYAGSWSRSDPSLIFLPLVLR